MATPYRFKRSAVSGKRPGLTDLEKGELALNFYDGHLFAEVDTAGVGIGTTIANLTPWKENFSSNSIKYVGIVSATDFHGNQVIGTPTGGSFRAGAYTPTVNDYTKDSVDELNYILGKLVPTAPDTIAGETLTLASLNGNGGQTEGKLCAGFTPTNNTGDAAPNQTGSTTYKRNTDQTITTAYMTEYGPADSGKTEGYVNAVGVGTTTLNISFGLYAVKSDNGTYGAIQIANDKDAADSTRNVGITSLFYEVCDRRITGAACPNGYNKATIKHGSATSAAAYWYEDPSTVGAPVLSFSAVTIPASPNLLYSSGIPHYKNHADNAFTYVLTVENAAGDMYRQNNLVTSDTGQQEDCQPTSGTKIFTNPGHQAYTDFASGTIPPARNYGVGTGVTCLISQTPADVHKTCMNTDNHFTRWDCTTVYGASNNIRLNYDKNVNIMGTSARTNEVDEDNIGITGTLGSGSGNATRVPSLSLNDTPSYSSANYTWGGGSAGTLAAYEGIVRGADLTHDRTDYSAAVWLPPGPDLSGRSNSNAQYFTFQFIRSAVSEFNISVTGSYGGCWVNMPNNSSWTTGLSNTNGWANMFAAYSGSGVPNNANSGCSDGGAMGGTSGTFKCVFGTESSTNDSNNRILVRIKLDSGDAISALTIAAT